MEEELRKFIDELKSGDNQESLELIKVPLDEKNVEFLLTEAATIPALRSIVLQRCSLQLASIEKICGWANQNKHITTLDLARNVLSEDSFGCLGKYLANPDCALVKLSLSATQPSPASIAALAEGLKANSSLKELIFQNCGLAASSLLVLADVAKHNKTLHTLDILDNIKADTDADAVNTLIGASLSHPSLFINVGWTLPPSLFKAAFDSHAHYKGTSFNLKAPRKKFVDEEGVFDFLNTNTSIQSITLEATGFGPKAAQSLAAAIASNATLKSITVHKDPWGDEVGAAFARAIGQNQSISEVELQTVDVGVATFHEFGEALKTNTALRRINLNYNFLPIEDKEANLKAMQSWEEGLKHNNTLQVLELQLTELGPGLVHLFKGLKENKGLTTLKLGSNDIDEAATELAEALAHNSTLQHLHLETLKVKRKEDQRNTFKVFSDGFSKNTGLVSLDLSHNKFMFRKESFASFSEALGVHPNMKVLHLVGWKLGKKNEESIDALVSASSNLKVLNLGYNNGNSSKGKLLKPIVPQVQANKTPKKLIFAGNELKTEHCKEFMEALKTNTSLVSLDVSSNSLDNAMGDLLVEVLQTNKTLRRIKHAHSLHEKDINKRLAENMAANPNVEVDDSDDEACKKILQ